MPLVPNGDMPHLDAMAEDVWLSAAIPRPDPDILRDNRERGRNVV
jgi:hypothetical protein